MSTIKQAFVGIVAMAFLVSVAGAQTKQNTKKTAGSPYKPTVADYGDKDFSFATLDGKTVRLSDYAGKVVLVSIWAPWCPPCKMETPGFAKVRAEYKAKGFEILSVAVQTTIEDVRAFVSKYKMDWPVGMEDKVARQYRTYGLPDNYLFNADGTVANHFVGYTQESVLRSAVEEAIARTSKTKEMSAP